MAEWSKQPKSFRTLGVRLRRFGRKIARSYIAPIPQRLPVSVPSWQEDADTPLVWRKPEDSTGALEVSPIDTGEDNAITGDLFQEDEPAIQRQSAQRPAPRPTQTHSSEIDPRLSQILAFHERREQEAIQRRQERLAELSPEIRRIVGFDMYSALGFYDPAVSQ